MGGYGLYVWGSALGAFLLMIGEVIGVTFRRRSLLRKLHQQIKARQIAERKP
ncbi:heme exporter protein CcmD [Ampullimonas aquatilis]|uniref:heme exporter protein CcmD n=1 Tax=Ampullimonas aquatilis TaxID=1341549 RepID=UPI003C7470D4